MEDLTIKLGTDHLNWEDVNQLFIQAPLGSRPPELFQKACELSGVVVSIFKQNRLVGFGRALTDFSAYASYTATNLIHSCGLPKTSPKIDFRCSKYGLRYISISL